MIKRMIRVFCAFVLAGVALPGCAKVSHLDQLLTIQAYSKSNEEKERFVKAADKRFEALLHEVKTGRLKRTMRLEDIRNKYGSPVYEQIIVGGKHARTLWMYRRQTDYAGAEKVYLYFDEQGVLLDWEYETSKAPENAS